MQCMMIPDVKGSEMVQEEDDFAGEEKNSDMVKIIEFPTKSVRVWTSMEQTLRKALTEANMPLTMADEIVSHMRKHWEKYSNMKLAFEVQLPSGIDDAISEAVDEAIRQGVEDMAEQIQNLTNHALLDLLVKEIQLCTLRTQHPDAS